MKKKFVLLLAFLTTGFISPSIDLAELWDIQNTDLNHDLAKQSYCFEDNGIVFGKNIDLMIKPASVSKLYTTLWAVDKLGKNFKFRTKFTVKNNDLFIVGGDDPFFVTENILMAMSVLEKNGFNHFDNVYFSADFLFNWTDSTLTIKHLLSRIMNTDRWKSSTTQTYNEAKDYLAKVSSHLELNITQFTANNVEVIQSIHLADEDFSFTMKSSPMWQHLKQVNIYSNNFYSDNIFSFLGGSAEFSQYMTSKLAVTNKDIYFHTGSGLGDNYTTCKTTLKMLVALEELSKDQGFNLEDIISVPGIDGGTLRNRFTDLRYSKKLLAKTGTLRDTSTLSGYLFNDTKTIKFAVFNHTVDRVSARKMQNKFIKSSIDLFTNINAIEYNKVEYNPLSEVQIIK